MPILATRARRTLLPLIEHVNQDQEVVEIASGTGDVVLMPADEDKARQETAYLLHSPANARRLPDSS